MDPGAASPQRATIADEIVSVLIDDDGVRVGDKFTSWLEVDDLDEGAHSLGLCLSDGTFVALEKLGSTHDMFVSDVRQRRRKARFPALALAVGNPLFSFFSRDPSGPRKLHLFEDVLIDEPHRGEPFALPLGFVDAIEKSGPTLTVRLAGYGDRMIRSLGSSTDEFEHRLRGQWKRECDRAREVCRTLVPSGSAPIESLGRPYRITEQDAKWADLVGLVESGPRAGEFRTLRELSRGDVSMGVIVEDSGEPVVFVIARVGGCQILEGLSADDRATFVFRGGDVETLAFLSAQTRFRREILTGDESEMGRLATATRASSPAIELRHRLAGRIVHDGRWESNLSALLGRAVGEP